jgi:hypothetical protein
MLETRDSTGSGILWFGKGISRDSIIRAMENDRAMGSLPFNELVSQGPVLMRMWPEVAELPQGSGLRLMGETMIECSKERSTHVVLLSCLEALLLEAGQS